MKIAYVLIPSIVAVSAAVGAAIATVHQSAPDVRPTPTPSTAPIASPTPSTTPSTTPIPERPAPQPTPEPLSRRSPVTIDGIGPVRVGMTIAQAEAAAGIPIRSAGDSGNESCSYFEPQGIDGLLFMVTEGRIARVDVVRRSSIAERSRNGIATLSGVGIGNTEAEIEAIYPGQIEVSPHEYVPGGHYLTFVPNDAADRNYRLVFETDENGVVTQFRSGKLSEVTWVEGCA